MSAEDAGYNPLSYHNGTVWPHDTSLAAWGLARAGRREQALELARSLLDAGRSFEWSLPEVFAGFARAETPFPIAYPTAARPQAWAAGTPVLLLQLLLGLEPGGGDRGLQSDDLALPPWAGRIRLDGVRARGKTWSVAGDATGIRVKECG
jgi:glycogen debranching enzyme